MKPSPLYYPVKNRWDYQGTFDDVYARIHACPCVHEKMSTPEKCPWCSSIWSIYFASQAFQEERDQKAADAHRAAFIAKERAKNGYITKRDAPNGYVAVTKPLARKVYENGGKVTIAGNNVNSFHIFNGWRLGCTIDLLTYTSGGDDFQDRIDRWLGYLESELGTYPVFYVEKISLAG